MRSPDSLDRLDTAFDDHRLVADAGLLLPATLAQHPGLKALIDAHLDLLQQRSCEQGVTMHRYAIRDVSEAGPC